MQRDNPAGDAVGSVLDVSKPAIGVAVGNIAGTNATNYAVSSFLGSQSSTVRKGAAVALPVILGAGIYQIIGKKYPMAKSFAIGNVLSGVENGLKLVIPRANADADTGGDSSDSDEDMGEPQAVPMLPAGPVDQAEGGLLGPGDFAGEATAPDREFEYAL